MKNSDDKLTIRYETLEDFYDIYVNGINAAASGTLYLTADDGVLSGEEAILINGEDSGETGVEYDFDVISDYAIKVNDFQPLSAGELDFIYVENNNLYKLSDMYNYGYHKINITVSDGFGVIPVSEISNIEANSIYSGAPAESKDPWNVYDGDETTQLQYAYNVSSGYLTFTFNDIRPVGAIRFLANPPNETTYAYVQWATTLDNGGDWATVSNGSKSYSKLHWGNEWFDYNFGEIVNAKYIRLVMNTFVTTVNIKEVELYGSSLNIEEEPVNEFVIDSHTAYNSISNKPTSNLTDGDTATSVNYGYNVSYQTLLINAKQQAKIGTIRLYFNSLYSTEWIKIEVLTDHHNGEFIEVVPQTDHGPAYEHMWREFDISDQQISGSAIRITTGTGFVNAATLGEIEVLPW